MTIAEFINTNRTIINRNFNTLPIIECVDGFSVSLQCSYGHYCSPRENLADGSDYTSFELGFPNMVDDMLGKYAEDPSEPLNTVYGYVPLEVVNELIAKHGGLA